MNLIVMAHRGEAQEFIKHFSMKADSGINNLYHSEDNSLLICGEGIFEVFTKLPYVLGKLKYSYIYNLGIAGSLNSKVVPGQIIEVRTSYNYANSKTQFESFSSTNPNSRFDCITTDQRVLSDEFAKSLIPFADIVDRELWAIAKIAKEQKIPLQSFKLISDIAGNDTNCFDLKAMAKEFSSSMLDYFLQNHGTAYSEETTPLATDFEVPFHISFTQRKRAQKLINKLQISPEVLISNFIKQNLEIKNKKQLPNLFIQFLENEINPINTVIEQRFNQELAAISSCGAKVIFDKKLDTKKVSIHFDINSQANIDKMQEALSKTKFSNIEKIWAGKFDV